MDHSVRRGNIGLGDVSSSDLYRTTTRIDVDFSALHRVRTSGLSADIAGHDLALQHVECEDLAQLLPVLRLQEVLNSTGGQLRERIVCWRKDGERAIALQGLDEPCCLYRRNKGVELAGRNCGFHDVRCLSIRRYRGCEECCSQ